MASTKLDNTNDLAVSLASNSIDGSTRIQVSQVQHRLDINAAWFGNLRDACDALTDRVVLEVGCGQGDMTLALAHLVRRSEREGRGKVLALDPASLDYGSPFTLGQSQEHISKTDLGQAIEWIQQDPMCFIQDEHLLEKKLPEYIVLAHSIFYLPSEAYLSKLLASLRKFAIERTDGKATKLLLSEWAMRTHEPAAEAHVLAVKAQGAQPVRDGNVRAVIPPEQIVKLAREAGWNLEREHWIESPSLDDGAWEVSAARGLDYSKASPQAQDLIDAMKEAASRHKEVRSMDVWTGVLSVT